MSEFFFVFVFELLNRARNENKSATQVFLCTLTQRVTCNVDNPRTIPTNSRSEEQSVSENRKRDNRLVVCFPLNGVGLYRLVVVVVAGGGATPEDDI
jgi:hypothetical protein